MPMNRCTKCSEHTSKVMAAINCSEFAGNTNIFNVRGGGLGEIW